MSAAALLAQGKALALVAAMLQRGGVISVEEFGNILGLFAVTVGETESDEGDILALWAGIVKESAGSPEMRLSVLCACGCACEDGYAGPDPRGVAGCPRRRGGRRHGSAAGEDLPQKDMDGNGWTNRRGSGIVNGGKWLD